MVKGRRYPNVSSGTPLLKGEPDEPVFRWRSIRRKTKSNFELTVMVIPEQIAGNLPGGRSCLGR
ncbi:hypothetical protein KCP78_07695 [Salmonella enterica subsp. enterica]|nr:hypothetical protein KCP78_07695 [Salmonella enterica subsp. enterica]